MKTQTRSQVILTFLTPFIVFAGLLVAVSLLGGCASTHGQQRACSYHYSYDGAFYGETCRELH